ncbi:MAG: hypothetical protein C0506_08705 [Anaerolinea sp.]|nr:hypothetical protein [Anaerolinea sp.]
MQRRARDGRMGLSILPILVPPEGCVTRPERPRAVESAQFETERRSMITIVAKLQAAPGKEAELKEALTKMVAAVKANEAGAVPTYSLHVAKDDPTTFLFYEQYASAEAQEAHGKTAHMAELGGSLRGVLAGRPVIESYTQIAGVQ